MSCIHSETYDVNANSCGLNFITVKPLEVQTTFIAGTKFAGKIMKKNALKWVAATPSRRPDCIVSSKARENNEIGFIPSYEKEPRENMYFILSYEYLRIWLKERSQYELDTFSKLEVEGGGSDVRRRYVQRQMRPKPGQIKKLPPIKLQQFTKATAKIDAKRKIEKKEH